MRRLWITKTLTAKRFSDAVGDLVDLPMDRYPARPFMRRAYELRANVTAYDATYVALAEQLGCELLTVDGRLSRAATTPSAALVITEPVFSKPEQLALAGFLAGYTGLTREAYALDLRQYATWCGTHSLHLFQVRRADIECFARDLEAAGRAQATITRRLCTIAGLYKYAVEEDLLDHSPAVHVRRPRLDYESHARRQAGRRRIRKIAAATRRADAASSQPSSISWNVWYRLAGW